MEEHIHTEKCVLRHYHYRSYSKLGLGVVSSRKISCSFHACTTQLFLPWDYKIKDACYQPIYGRVYYCKCYIILGSHNNWIIMNFIDYVADEVYYEQTNTTILDGNVTSM